MLDHIGSHDFNSLYGSKAYNLHLLYEKGFSVPKGFSIQDGYWDLDKIKKAVEQIGGFPVAVRSSGQLEDLSGASFAGLYQTFLDINDFNSLKGSIEKCFSCVSIQRVKNYLNHKGINVEESDLRGQFSVFIQKMVDAKMAGVAFSINPLSGKEEEILIECCHGLGEKLVSGQISPSQYIINSFDFSIINAISGDQKVALDFNNIKDLTSNILSIQSFFGVPQDIEWAIDKEGKLWILQSRPITSIAWDKEVDEFTNADLKDGGVSSRACTPMMFSLYHKIFSSSMHKYGVTPVIAPKHLSQFPVVF